MKKSAIVLFFAAFLSLTALAQNVQEGVTNFYAERYQSAKSVFEKLVATNPNNMEATYWLGQTYIAMNDLKGARGVYEKALAANGNAPLILAGMGHVELLEGKTAEARQRFDAAIAASKGRKGFDPLVLNAVGRANVNAYSDQKKLGDLDYAIARLNEAAQIAPTNPEIFLNLGNAYRKKHQGSEAVQAYRKAGNFAPAIYRTALLYQTQTQYGQGNWDVVLENLNSAVAADPKFAPAYEQLYDYYLRYKQDFATAEQYANKYVSNTDPSVENDYLLAQTKFVQNNFNEAINIAKNILARTNNNPKPRVYRLLGYSYMDIKDTATACQYAAQLLEKATEEDLYANDYILHAQSCGKNNPDIIRTDVTKAVNLETELSNKIAMLTNFRKAAKESGDKVLEAELALMSYNLRGKQTDQAELFQIGLAYYLGSKYQKSDSLFVAYATAFPDSIYGYYWSALSRSRIDTTMEQGIAVPQFDKSLQIASTDKVRFKSQGLQAASTLAAYYNNVKKDKETAISYLQRGLEFDPANATLQNFLNILKSSSSKPAAPAKDTKVKTDNNKVKTKTKGK